MSSNLRVDRILPSTGTEVGVGTATGSVALYGDVNVAGTLTYEDVTNIDSVGVITARNGLNVTGGSVGIGTDTTDRQLAVYHATQGTIEIKSSDNGQSSLWFSDISDGNVGGVYYEHSNNAMGFRANDVERLRITSNGNIGVGGATGTDYSLLDGIVTNTANGSAGLLINSSSSSHNAYMSFGYGSGSGTSHADQFSAYIGRVGDDNLILGTNNNIRVSIDSSGRLL